MLHRQFFRLLTSSICNVARFLKTVRIMPETDSGFGGRDDHHEERIDVAVDLFELIRERDKAQIHRVEHQLDGHEHGDDVLAEQEAGNAQRKQDRGQQQIPGQRDRGRDAKACDQISFLASTTAPMIAIRIRNDVTSNGQQVVGEQRASDLETGRPA